MSVSRPAKPLSVIFTNAVSVNQRISRYQQTKHPVLSQEMGSEETISVWYSLRHMEEIMKELIYLNSDGVRIYFGAYEQDHEKYPGQLCLLFVPTYTNPENGKHRDIILEQEANYHLREESSPYPGEEALKNLNFGSLCKPDCSNHELYYPNNELV